MSDSPEIDVEEPAARREARPDPGRGPVGPDRLDLGAVRQAMDVDRPVLPHEDEPVRFDGVGGPPGVRLQPRPGPLGLDVVEGQRGDHLVAQLRQILGRGADLAGDPHRLHQGLERRGPPTDPAREPLGPGLLHERPAQLGLALPLPPPGPDRGWPSVVLLRRRHRVPLLAVDPGRRHRPDHQDGPPASPPAGSTPPAPGSAATTARAARPATPAATGSDGLRRTGPAPPPSHRRSTNRSAGSLAIAFRTIVSRSRGIRGSCSRGRARLVVEDRVDELHPVGRPERRLERQHLVERHSQAVDVAPRVRLPLEPLRRHVAQRADDVAGAGQLFASLRLGQAEVGHPDRSLQVQKQVGRLDVSVHNSVAVRIGEGLRRLHAQSRYAAEVMRLLGPEERRDR